jgi:serine/threonine protein kinase
VTKPTNILLSKLGATKIADFGTAIRPKLTLWQVYSVELIHVPERMEGRPPVQQHVWSLGMLECFLGTYRAVAHRLNNMLTFLHCRLKASPHGAAL